jgi:membrane protein involved in colicin uptake
MKKEWIVSIMIAVILIGGLIFYSWYSTKEERAAGKAANEIFKGMADWHKGVDQATSALDQLFGD